MGSADQRAIYKFYGIYQNDWVNDFGKFQAGTHYELTREYISDACDTTDYTAASAGTDINIDVEFMYPNHIKRQYSIEGVVEGEFTVACNGGNSTVTQYRVSVWKTNFDTTYEEICTTDWVVVSTSLTWDAGYSVGEEMVYHYRIDQWDHYDLTEYDRIFIKIEIQCTATNTRLMHSNDSDWTDIWVEVPLRLD